MCNVKKIMKKNTLYTIIIAAACINLGACNFLDKNPDMRATIDTKDKVRLLLVSAYADANSLPIMEMSSDNIIDNNAPDSKGHCRSMNSLGKMYDEMFAWEQVVSSGEQDSPKYIWDGNYSAIAACNQALQAIADLEKQGKNMDAEKGEALLSRAYHHFLLACVFCQPYKTDALSENDLGLVYMTAPETTVKPEYHRESLTKTYQHIQEDLEAGLALVSDEYYSVPKYHFNVKAAHAFAARFYLYKRDWNKVISNADLVLGNDTNTILASLFDNYNTEVLISNPEVEQYAWIDASSPANLLLMSSYSTHPYSIYPTYGRYQLNGDAFEYSIHGEGPIWKSGYLTRCMHMWYYEEGVGNFLAKFLSYFEYTDKVNGYGYIHAINRHLTTNETLLCRAEARVMNNDIDGGVQDLRLWCRSYDVNPKGAMDSLKLEDGTYLRAWLTRQKIESFYKDAQDERYAPKLKTEELYGETVPADKVPYIRCCLHFRRIENIHDGWRWMDLKRYGIEITHIQGTNKADKLIVNDPRRAIQLPQEVILAGLEANPRAAATSVAESAPLVPAGELTPMKPLDVSMYQPQYRK